MGQRTIRFCWSHDGGKSYSRSMLWRGHPYGSDQGQDQKAGMDPWRRYPDCNPLVIPGWKVWYHLPLSSPPGGLVKKEPVPVNIFSRHSCNVPIYPFLLYFWFLNTLEFENYNIFLSSKKNWTYSWFLWTSLYRVIKENNCYLYAAHGKEY